MSRREASARRLAELVGSEIGLRDASEQLDWIVAAAERSGEGVDDVLDALGDEQTSAAAMQRLIDEVTVKESFFFRQAAQLEAIDWDHLLRCARSDGRDEIRVWSAACATGEEAYTLAILAAEQPAGGAPPVSILGTDVSAAALAHARGGRYGPRAVRHVPASALDRHLGSEHGCFRIGAELRRRVRFAHHNLAGARALPAGETPFDLIVCRNVLIYFDDGALDRTAAALEQALAPGGTLVLGAADRLCLATRAARRDRAHAQRPARPPVARTPGERPGRRGPARGALVQRRRSEATPPDEGTIRHALRLADAREVGAALEVARRAVALEPLDAESQFVTGMLELAAGDPRSAVSSLRRALYADPTFGIAAFQLGRAYDATGDEAAALRAHRQALATLHPHDERAAWLLGGLDLADVASACRQRLGRA